MSNHTPQPWKRSTRSWGGTPYWVVEDQTGAIICQAEVGFHEYESGSFITVEEEIAANVNLITAAPGLLKVAKLTSGLLGTIECTSPGFSDGGVLHTRLLLNLEMLDAVIAEAEREKP